MALQFLNPVALFALAGMLVPLVIHLWNIKQGKTLKVGSIILLGESARQSSSSLRLREWLLLLLRCLLIALFALLLAGPVWRKAEKAGQLQRWLVIGQNDFNRAYAQHKPLIDSLLAKGYELHNASAGFETYTPADSGGSRSQAAAGWKLLNLLNARLPAGSEVHAFTAGRLSDFAGTKPATSLDLNWHLYRPADSAASAIAAAYLTGTDSLRVQQSRSTFSSTTYGYQALSLNRNDHTQVDIRIREGKTFVALKNDSAEVPLDTAGLSVGLVHRNSPDAAWLRAALAAIRQFTGRPLQLREYATLPQAGTSPDWLFILDENPSGLAGWEKEHPRTRVLSYAGGKIKDSDSWLTADGRNIRLYRRYEASKGTDVIWQDGQGIPLLAASGKRYTFYSRFNPQWTDLVWSREFPGLLLALLADRPLPPAGDMRRIDPAQLRIKSAGQPAAITTATTSTLLQPLFALLLILAFAAERILSFTSKPAAARGN